jgi:hypothetical protein
MALTCVALAAALGGIAGCGDDESDTTTPTTEPAALTGPTGPTTGGEPPGEAPGDGDLDLEDGTVTPPPEADPDTLPGEPQPQDSPQNDVPPPAGSAAEQFEEFCDENPEACR